MKFIVIGASGFVGREIYAACRSAGYPTLGTRHNSQQPDLLSFDLVRQNLKDLLQPDFLTGDGPIFGVVCSSLSQIDACKTRHEESYAINVTHTLKILAEMKPLGITPVFLSTSFVFDGKNGSYLENSAHSPISAYGRHKSIVEKELAISNPNAIIARLDKVLGTDPGTTHLFSQWEKSARENKTIACIAGQTISPTLASDIGNAIRLGCEKGLSGIYNIANPEQFDRCALARIFLSRAGLAAEVVAKPQNEFNFADPRPILTTLDSTRFREATGFRFTPMATAIESYLELSASTPR
jgi:dTDP-4-dehydrorhamnose reductase